MLERLGRLSRHFLIYGIGDSATALIGLLLLPVFTRYLSPTDYGVLTMLLIVDGVARAVFRWGVDIAFMRLYFDCASDAARQRLASTLFFFLLVVNGSLLLVGLLLAGWLGVHLIGEAHHGVLIGIALVDAFVSGFFFIPYQVLRIREQSRQYITFTITRSIANVTGRLALVVGAGMGVVGIVISDLVVTLIMTVLLARLFTPLIRPTFSTEVLREGLQFGLPRIPHNIAQQVMTVADRYILKAYGTLADVGLYAIGANFGLALKLALAAFESAWTPFFLGVMRDADAPRTYGALATYVVACLVLLVTGVCALAGDAVRLFTAPEFHAAARVTPWIAIAVLFQGLYLVGSIGLIITKRTKAYPVATGSAVTVNILANLLLVPRFGMMGAAWSSVIGYATLAVIASTLAWRVYPIRYEWSRLARIAAAGIVAYLSAAYVIPESVPPALGLLLRSTTVAAVYATLLWLTGFLTADERQALFKTS